MLRIQAAFVQHRFSAYMENIGCFRSCPRSRLDDVLEQYSMFIKYICSPMFGRKPRESERCLRPQSYKIFSEFWGEFKSLANTEFRHFWRSCNALGNLNSNGTDADNDCKYALSTTAGTKLPKMFRAYENCFNEHVKHAVDMKYSMEAITAAIGFSKIATAVALEKSSPGATVNS